MSSFRVRTGIRKQHAATIKDSERRVEGGTTHLPGGKPEYQVKKIEPSIIAHISAANIMPNGRSEPLPFSWCASLKAGNLKKIQRYIDPSKKHVVMANAHKRLSALIFVSASNLRRKPQVLTVFDKCETALL